MRRYEGRVAILGLAAGLVGSLASAQAVISIDPIAQTTSTGTMIDVDVLVSNVQDLYGYQFDLTFDPSILRAVSSSEGTFLASGGNTFFISGNNDNTGGTVSETADTLLTSVSGVSGTGLLATFTFDAVGTGTSALSIQNEILLDSNINVISDTTVSGAVTVTSQTAVAPEIDPASACGALALLLGGIAVVRSRSSSRVAE